MVKSERKIVSQLEYFVLVHYIENTQTKYKSRFQSSVFFKIKITHCLETIYTRVTKNSCPGISIHRFVNYTHMVTSVLAKRFIGNIHKAL